MQEFKVSKASERQRADIFVASHYPAFTRSSLEALFDRRMVQINGTTAKAAQKLKVGDKVSVDETLLNAEPPEIELPILYEDDDVMVIDKPAGILTHSKGALNLEGSVASFIKSKITDKELTGNRAGIVHRLDRATSGVIIVAKNSLAQRWLQKQFSLRKAKKVYLAVIEGELDPPSALIDAPIGRNPKKPQTFMVTSSGKAAQTEYHTLKTFEDKNKRYSLLELKPFTGRTHQLRVHLTYLGHPIVGDRIYGQAGEKLYLHAKSLEITLPNRERKTFSASIPSHIGERA